MVNRQLREEADPPVPRSLPDPVANPPRAKDPMAYLAFRVSSKLEQGHFKVAVRLTCSDATIADKNDSTFEALQQKHPPSHPDSSIPPLAETADPPTITVSEEEIVHAIRSFPNDSAGGPEGLRPQHLKGMTGPTTNGGAQALLSALTRFVTLVLQALG